MKHAVRGGLWALAGFAAIAAAATMVIERDHLRIEIVETPARNVITVTDLTRDASGQVVAGEPRVYTEAPR